MPKKYMKTDVKGIQRFALGADGAIIDVRGLDDRSGSFFCPACHDAMIPKMGKKREWHFAHKTCACSYESYLHKMAKLRIADWFRKSESIMLEMKTSEVCEKHKDCVFYDMPGAGDLSDCSRSRKIRHDLKKYYHDCDIERPCEGFVADILCPRANNPLLIEIFVNHECSEEKRASGLRIIEFAIESEEDINRIVSSNVIRESETARLYGFRNREKLCAGFKKQLSRFTLYKSGKSHVGKYDIDCKNRHSSRNSATRYEVITSACREPAELYLVGRAMAYKKGYLKRSCSLCAYLGGGIGRRFCKLGNRNSIKTGGCFAFRENRQLVDECVDNFENFFDPCEVWRS